MKNIEKLEKRNYKKFENWTYWKSEKLRIRKTCNKQKNWKIKKKLENMKNWEKIEKNEKK